MPSAIRSFLLCTLLAFAAAAPAASQTISSGVRAGVVLATIPGAGAVMDQISGGPSVDVTSRLGLTAGGFVKFDATERLSFQPELMFVMKGVRLQQAAAPGTATATLHYLEFPLLLRYTDYLTDDLTGYVIGGPAFAFRAGSRGRIDGPNQTRDLNIHDAFTSRDTGVTVGGGLQFRSYLIDARYTWGLTDVATSAYFHPDPLRNRAFTVSIGLAIP